LIAPVEVGQFIHKAIPGSTLAMIENTGHCPHLSAPAASVDAIRAFLYGAR
jgi:sigma-B regulation protein RsbQ